MPFSKFDYSDFPLVKVKFSDRIKDKADFEAFLEEWLQIYFKKKDFYFEFETGEIEWVGITYLQELANFMKKVKTIKNQYLKGSILILRNSVVKTLFEMLMKLQKPVATLYIVKNEEEANAVWECIKNNEEVKNVKMFLPSST